MSVTLRDVGVAYGGRSAVRSVDLDAAPGHVLALVGPNGSGKSSLLKAVASLVPHTGRIDTSVEPSSGGLSYMPQSFQPCAGLTVLEVVLLGRVRSLALQVREEDIDAAAQALRLLGIGPIAGRAVDQLSGGQRQLVFLAQSLVSGPRVLLLDEPVSALDLRNQLHVLDLVRGVTHARQLATIIVLHDLTLAARYADEVAMMCDGRLVAIGSPAATLTSDRIAATFRVRVETLTSPGGQLVIHPLGAMESPHQDAAS